MSDQADDGGSDTGAGGDGDGDDGDDGDEADDQGAGWSPCPAGAPGVGTWAASPTPGACATGAAPRAPERGQETVASGGEDRRSAPGAPGAGAPVAR